MTNKGHRLARVAASAGLTNNIGDLTAETTNSAGLNPQQLQVQIMPNHPSIAPKTTRNINASKMYQ